MTARDIVLSAAGATPAQGWQLITLTGTLNPNQVAYGNGYYVAVGVSALHQPYSTDLQRWFPSNKLNTAVFNSIAFGNNTFVAAGGTGSGAVSTMTDPTVGWTVQATPAAFAATTITSVAFGAGLFVAVGAGGVIATSPNGVTWTTRTSGVAVALAFVRYANNSKFYATSRTTTLISSPDGITWTTEATLPANISSIDYGNGYFVAPDGSQNVYTSTDLITWNGPYNVSAGLANQGIATNGAGTWITGGNTTSQQLKYSTDNGVNWTSTPYPQRLSLQVMSYINGPAYLNGRFVAIGGTSAYGVIVSSKDGINWIRNFAAGGNNVSYINNKFWFGGRGNGSYMVFDPVTTKLEYVNFPQPAGTWNFAIYFNGLYIVGGQSGVLYSIPVGYDYQDSTNWTSRTSNFGLNIIYSAAINGTGTTAIIVGQAGSISSSTDGTTWTARTSGTANNLIAVAWFNDKFVAVGDAGTLVTSTDGTTWTVQTAIAALNFASLAVSPTRIMTMDTLGAIYTSANGITWAVGISPFAGSNGGPYPITYGKGKFYATTSTSASIYSSADNGTNWTRVDSPQGGYQTTPTDFMNAIGYGGGYLLVIGGGATTAASVNVSYYQAI
jgi:hypothetical protein